MSTPPRARSNPRGRSRGRAGQRPGRRGAGCPERSTDPAEGRGGGAPGVRRAPALVQTLLSRSWPTDPPTDIANDPLGAIAQRRITDAAVSQAGKGRAIHTQCASYTRGNTDLAWDADHSVASAAGGRARPAPPHGHGSVRDGGADQPQRRAARRWLGDRLKVKVARKNVRARHHRGRAGDQGRADQHRARGRQAGDVSLPRASRPADRRQRRDLPGCWPRSCRGSTRTTCTPRPPASWSRSGARHDESASRSTTTPPALPRLWPASCSAAWPMPRRPVASRRSP